MQWPDKSKDAPIKPYNPRRCKLTNSNCAIDVEKQVRLYMEWARERGLKQVHIFPPGRMGYARMAYETLLKQPMDPGTKITWVDPEEWK